MCYRLFCRLSRQRLSRASITSRRPLWLRSVYWFTGGWPLPSRTAITLILIHSQVSARRTPFNGSGSTKPRSQLTSPRRSWTRGRWRLTVPRPHPIFSRGLICLRAPSKPFAVTTRRRLGSVSMTDVTRFTSSSGTSNTAVIS